MRKIPKFKRTAFGYIKLGLKIKRSILLLFITLFSIQAKTYSQTSRISLDLQQIPLEDVLDEIETQTEFKFIFNTDAVDLNRIVSLKTNQTGVNQVLKELFSNTITTYEIDNRKILLRKTNRKNKIQEEVNSIEIQQFLITGTVKDADGQPLPRANIIEKNTKNGTQTDFDGNFSISVADKNAVLMISYIGFTTNEIPVNEQKTINITLLEDESKLDEIVLVGYGGIQKKSDLTGAIVQLSTKDFEEQPVTNFDQVLQGRTAGVQVIQSSGAPGDGFKIRVRGSNSITGNNDPLYVVDGIIDVEVSSINPNDIASINVLKDASATAIYGNQGANGVVIITTKEGRDGISTIEYNAFLSFDSLRKKVDVLGAVDFANLVNQRAPDTFSSTKLEDLRTSGGTNWQNEVFKSGLTQNHQLAFSGGKENFNYYVSGNLVNQEGIVINSGYKRYGLRTKLNGKVSDKMNLSLSINASREDRLNTGDRTKHGANLNDLVVQGALLWDPTSAISGDNYKELSPFASIKENPVGVGKRVNRNQFKNTFQGNIAVDYTFFKGFNFNSSFGFQLADVNDRNFRGAIGNLETQGFISNQHSVNWQSINRLSYKTKFDESHNLSADFIYEIRRGTDRQSSIQASDFDTEAGGVDNIALGADQTTTSSFAERKLKSYFGRVNYDYQGKYLLSASFRIDGTSVFPNNKTGYFPAVALGWNISKEAFMDSQDFIHNLKLRGSWGITGNQNIAPFSTLSLLSVGASSNFSFDGSSTSVGIGPSKVLANPNLKWEETTQINIGIDVDLLQNHISLSADYYVKDTKNLLLERSLPSYTGLETQLVNAGTVENKGYEFNLNLRPLSYNSELSWNSGFNISFNETKVISLLEDQDEIIPETFFGAGASGQIPFTSIKVGGPLGNFRGFQNIGIWQSSEAAEALKFGASPGDWKFKDEDGNGKLDNKDITVVGNGTPDFVWGLNNNFSYKAFDLNILIQGSVGNDVFNLIRSSSFGQTSDVRQATAPELLNAWTVDKPNSKIPRLDSPSKLLNSYFVEDGSFTRLKNISLGYNLSEELLEKFKISSAKVYVSAQNLITLTNYTGFDPEVSSGDKSDLYTGVDFSPYPLPKSIIVGVNLSL